MKEKYLSKCRRCHKNAYLCIKIYEMKKFLKSFVVLLGCLILMIMFLNIIKTQSIFYIPFDINGKQMAITIPPFGSFIEEKYRQDKGILCHEKAHWTQYERMGLFSFYSTYLKEYKEYHGRFNGPMEVEARKLTKVYLTQP